MIVSFLVAALTLVYSPSNALGDALPNAHLRLTFIGCTLNTTEDPRVSIFDLNSSREIVNTQMQRTAAPGVDTQTVQLPAGYYRVLIGRLPCVATRFVALLQGVDRTIVLKGADELRLSEALGGLAGALPDADFAVTASCINSSGEHAQYNAVIENSAYFFDHVKVPAECDIKLETSGPESALVRILRNVAVGEGGSTHVVIKNFDLTSLFNG